MALTPLAEGFCFGEGPRWFEDLVWFSDMLGEAVHTVTLAGHLSTLALPGHSPSGLGFCPDGSLLIVSTERRQVLRYDGESVDVYADLSDLVPASLGDMVIDRGGTAYVGAQARAAGVLVRLDPGDGHAAAATVVADGLDFPNGMALTPDGATLIVAESVGRRLTAFTVAPDRTLCDRRIFADGLEGPPDGLCLDAAGGVWTAMTLAHQFQRIVSVAGAATITDRIDIGQRAAIACALGGPQGRTLFLVSAADAYPERLRGTALSRIDATTVDVPAAEQP
ncbi:gluconolactonase [Mycolicibacterium duvalii]|uniref:Gluconolactonase n=1 Tax=Mycolicibacterium duvalii TaxID=39688 RepID=A0A7I7JZV8_9MYCO|nr:SMP-30/gluconolactonase/LRE family protein [Mycolicibacterium duvalii]MCV7370218.1 SMP-30/gluconolactonase/LRE family protein [Mycolicibacterium duvalii]PEG43616.1 gluconolactonase [Mycolicibacterium duvalii]BBX17416.1 gluconolactonase [Mycolicibacterium duvalii]